MVWTYTRGQVITQAVADAMLAQDLSEGGENAVKKFFAGVPLTRGQFDALVSFLYNVGPGKRGVKSGLFVLINSQPSTLARKVLARDYAGAAKEFPKWIYSGGEPLRGLERWRKAEQQLFLTGPGREAPLEVYQELAAAASAAYELLPLFRSLV